ncbi:hypothetical protein [Nostoc sp.]|uniref:hypothetical protein n=1 Tax=Nostoc sp. TaxID=1180 RepID=UPI002FF1B962
MSQRIKVYSYSIYHSSNSYIGIALAEKALQGLPVDIERRPIYIPKERGIKPGFLTTPLKARACAGEQGSRGAGESSMCLVLSPLPLCPSAPLLYQTPEACEKCGKGS